MQLAILHLMEQISYLWVVWKQAHCTGQSAALSGFTCLQSFENRFSGAVNLSTEFQTMYWT
ncbi:uncharacterized protein EAE98_004950 [Botrytis deweyae]|uniref:Uncharacterized protein n=1 Tax=Botrytis deweyae TaxID=2478750 RepID=A0ABQ7IQ32_9HELO|nr:uncharacterized protein EAE98_004950 [Botrytis deweyae]KAF7930550.1 hypothetical protein EAE98_004950 [Botrytis deweyae]